MAHSFKNFSAKAAFGVNKESNQAGDYILKKKANAIYCKSCERYTLNSQGDLNLLRMVKNKKKELPFNKNNLNINLVTKLDLKNVCVIEDASGNVCSNNGIVYSEIPNFYNEYIIDPSGHLFGNTSCGINNFLNYLVYNPPPPIPIPDNL